MEKNHIYTYDTFTGKDAVSTKLEDATKNVDVPVPEEIVQAQKEQEQIIQDVEQSTVSALNNEGHPAGVELSDDIEESTESERDETVQSFVEERKHIKTFERFNPDVN